MSLVDMLIVLENGKVTEIGSPQSLMQENGYVFQLGLDLGDEDVCK
jgi:ABC-type multidrug transport system fused ATPase/permease subunit